MSTKRLAIVGAGLAGLACARELVSKGFEVTLFEKSRGAGGRAPTRWINRDSQPAVGFDHGAQYFYSHSESFCRLVDEACQAGAVAPWTGRFVHLSYGQETEVIDPKTRWVGTPGMAGLGKFLARDLRVQLQAKVTEIEKNDQHYTLRLTKSDGTKAVHSGFDLVVAAIPAEQTVELFKKTCATLSSLAEQVKSNVNWTAMATFSSRIPVNFDAALVVDSPLGWICRDSSKPGRAAGERWLIQATSDWSKVHQDYTQQAIEEMLLDLFCSAIGKHVDPSSLTVHRWLYGLPSNPLSIDFYIDETMQLAACGDWLKGANMEDAFLSGQMLGQRLCGSLS